MSRLDDYLNEIGNQLQLGAEVEEDILLEVRSHLEDSTRTLQLGGLSREESEAKAMERFGDAKEIGEELRQAHGRGTRKEGLRAALPPLLFGVAWGLPLVIPVLLGGRMGQAARHLSLFYGMFVLVPLFIGVALYAIVIRLPLWSYTWVGAGLLATFTFLIALADDRPFLVSPTADVIIILALFGLILAALAWASFRHWLYSSLIGLAFTMLLSILVVFWASNPHFYRFDVALLSAPLGLAHAALLYRFVVGSDAERMVIVAMGTLLSSGAMLAASTVWREWERAQGKARVDLIFIAICMALVLFGPTLAGIRSWLMSRLRAR